MPDFVSRFHLDRRKRWLLTGEGNVHNWSCNSRREICRYDARRTAARIRAGRIVFPDALFLTEEAEGFPSTPKSLEKVRR